MMPNQFDERVWRWASAERKGVSWRAAELLSWFTGVEKTTFWTALFFMRRGDKASKDLFYETAAVALAQRVLKEVVHRRRPPGASETSRLSFPSGHAAVNSIALYRLTEIFDDEAPDWKSLINATAAFLALAIGASRLRLGEHWLSDVLAGYALAATILFF